MASVSCTRVGSGSDFFCEDQKSPKEPASKRRKISNLQTRTRPEASPSLRSGGRICQAVSNIPSNIALVIDTVRQYAFFASTVPYEKRWLPDSRLNEQDTHGNIPLLKALYSGDNDSALHLVERRADVNLKNISGEAPLTIACFNDSIRAEVVSALVQARADLGAGGIYTKTVLMEACDRNRDDKVKVLLDAKANSDIQSQSGWTALRYAAANSNVQIFKLLLKYGADWTIKDDQGRTPLDDSTLDVKSADRMKRAVLKKMKNVRALIQQVSCFSNKLGPQKIVMDYLQG